jgi:hypothetical protein
MVERKLQTREIRMALHRAILTLLVLLITAFAPVASVAMAKPCSMAVEKGIGNPSVCPCNAMPGCSSMPQCSTAVGCANYCFISSAILPNVAGQPAVACLATPVRYDADLQSLLIRPPIPPPRA